MMAGAAKQELLAHLASGVTETCRCWSVTRSDGTTYGFTDHDRILEFEGQSFSPAAGLEARTLVQTTGLSVDNTEAVGLLSDDAISEQDILAGRFDGAAIVVWLVRWSDVSARMCLFRGSIGEVRRGAGAFEAELRGLSEMLNQSGGLVYQAPCTAVLGDRRCRVDLSSPLYAVDLVVEAVADARVFTFTGLSGFEEGWFARGSLTMVSGEARDLTGLVKHDRSLSDGREIELWQELRAPVAVGDSLRLIAGCDRRAETCRGKFDNFLNFRGFPHVPGEDWLTSYPKAGQGGSGNQSLFQPVVSAFFTDGEFGFGGGS